jgi:hypothetical protein
VAVLFFQKVEVIINNKAQSVYQGDGVERDKLARIPKSS